MQHYFSHAMEIAVCQLQVDVHGYLLNCGCMLKLSFIYDLACTVHASCAGARSRLVSGMRFIVINLGANFQVSILTNY